MSRSRCAGTFTFWLSMAVVLTGCGVNRMEEAPAAKEAATQNSEGIADYMSKMRQPAASPNANAPLAGNAYYERIAAPAVVSESRVDQLSSRPTPTNPQLSEGIGPGQGGDKYAHLRESGFVAVQDQPLSTFSIDVDTASYSKARMYLLQQRTLPPVDSVRIEEFLNYFEYDYAPPTNGEPFAIHIETAKCPWQPTHQLARVALKGREVERDRPPCNLVFLIDVSGSMASAQKIGLVKQSLRLLTSQLTSRDTVAMVVYASQEGLVLPATEGDRHGEILNALERLEAGGSTNGGAGIRLAYAVAKEHLNRDGVNRVILCTDGDFNVGTTSTGDLVRLAENEAKAGVFLTVLGFGMGNHNDAMLEEISDKANGAYAFIDSDAEARKVFIDQINSTLVTIAKDVKIQIEFNPAHVAAYRLIGYENRLLQAHEFNDDKKDAGEVGAGHTITALYEIVPQGTEVDVGKPTVDPLKYQTRPQPAPPSDNDELFTLKLRYKQPNADRSNLLTQVVRQGGVQFSDASSDFRFATSVAAFGMLLRKSEMAGDVNMDAVLEIATAARGEDRHGYRAEFLQMVNAAKKLAPENQTSLRRWSHPSIIAVSNPGGPRYVVHSSTTPDGFHLSGLGWAIVAYLGVNFVSAVLLVVVIAFFFRRANSRCPAV